MPQNNNVKTIINLDSATTLELNGRPRSGRAIKATIKRVENAGEDNTHVVETELSMSDETVRNLIHVLEGYR